MKIIDFGPVNIDHLCAVGHFVRCCETFKNESHSVLRVFCQQIARI